MERPVTRWLTLLALLLAGSVLALAAHQGAAPVRAATLPSGWNLVSGPDGTTLSGASGLIYSLQPGDREYESFPADARLRAGWAYWAYFPTGGSLNSPTSQSDYSVTLVPGEWAMIGNPMSHCTVAIDGADTALTYTAADGYASVTMLRPGEGAWVQGAGRITLTPASCATSTALPSASATPSPATAGVDLLTINGLQGVALRASDMQGYSGGNLDARLSLRGGTVGYVEAWIDSNPRSPRIGVLNILETYASPALAHDAFVKAAADAAAPDRGVSNNRTIGPQGIGDEDSAAYFLYTGRSLLTGREFRNDTYIEVFRLGQTVVLVATIDIAPTGTPYGAPSYAGIIYNRMLGR